MRTPPSNYLTSPPATGQVLVGAGTDSTNSKLGLGHTDPVKDYEFIPFPYPEYTITKLVGTTWAWSIVVAKKKATNQDVIFVAGNNDNENLQKTNTELVYFFQQMDLSAFGASFSLLHVTGADNTLLVQTNDYKIWIAGNSVSCDVQPSTSATCPFRLISSPNAFRAYKKITSGEHHFLFLTHDGELYGLGKNSSATQALENKVRSTVSKFTEFRAPVADVFAGPYATMAVLEDNSVWVMGQNYNSILSGGVMNSDSISTAYEIIPKGYSAFPGRVISAAICSDAVMVLTSTHQFFISEKSEEGYVEQKISGTERDRIALVKVTSSSGERMVLTASGKVFGKGSNSYHALGDGDFTNWAPVTLPQAFKEKRVVQILTTSNSCHLLLGDPVADSLFNSSKLHQGKRMKYQDITISTVH